MSCEPWQCAEVSATKKALAITKPEVAVSLIKRAVRPVLVVGSNAVIYKLEGKLLIEYLIKRANRPILVVGSEAVTRDLGGKLLIKYLIDFARASKIPVVATAHMVGEFLKRGFRPAGFMSAMDIGNRLVDPEWKGIDGKGQYDLVLFVALPYYMEGLILSGLMHFAPKLRTITLDNKFHPHASWSFPNAGVKVWAENLKVITSKFEGGQ